MNRTWPSRNADSPPTNRSLGSISRTSPASEHASAATNHHWRCTRSVWEAGRTAAARVRAARTAGLAAYSTGGRGGPRHPVDQGSAGGGADEDPEGVTPLTLPAGAAPSGSIHHCGIRRRYRLSWRQSGGGGGARGAGDHHPGGVGRHPGASLVKRRARAGGHQSITHFHHQLSILEHSAPSPSCRPPTGCGRSTAAGRPPASPTPGAPAEAHRRRGEGTAPPPSPSWASPPGPGPAAVTRCRPRCGSRPPRRRPRGRYVSAGRRPADRYDRVDR